MKNVNVFIKLCVFVVLFIVNIKIFYAQNVLISDTLFLKGILKNYDLNKDGILDTSEANKIISLKLGILLPNHSYILANDLAGIEYFENLNDLYCSSTNTIYNIDLSKNLNLKSLTLPSIKLEYLNISNCKKLKNINISGNPKLSKVCVWTLPFPPDTSIKVDTSGSPNVKFDTICKSGDTTGIRENKQINVFSFYPNPASNKLFLSEMANVEIYSIDGKLLIRKKSAKDVDINNLSKGLYFIKLTVGSEIRVEKFVKE